MSEIAVCLPLASVELPKGTVLAHILFFLTRVSLIGKQFHLGAINTKAWSAWEAMRWLVLRG